MLGKTNRRNREAQILFNVYRDSGLGSSVQLITDTENKVDRLSTSVKSGVEILIIDVADLDINCEIYLKILGNKYLVEYRVTDDNVYQTANFKVKMI